MPYCEPLRPRFFLRVLAAEYYKTAKHAKGKGHAAAAAVAAARRGRGGGWRNATQLNGYYFWVAVEFPASRARGFCVLTCTGIMYTIL